MSVQAWAFVWKAVFFAGLGIFTVMALLVAVGGAKDLVSLFFGDANDPEKEG